MAKLKFCGPCWTDQERRGGYLNADSSEKVKSVKNCDVHPSLENRRLFRTMRTIKTWCLEIVGYTHSACKIAPMVHAPGHIRERNALMVLFDYEAPFVELLIHDGFIERTEGTPTLLSVTKKGDDWLRKWIEDEYQQFLKDQAA